MSKKKSTHKERNRAAGGRQGANEKPRKPGRRWVLWAAPAAAAAAAVWFSGWPQAFRGNRRDGPSFRVKGGERRPVLNPLQFGHRDTRRAYMAAQKYPEVMDALYCYCHCDQPPFLHNSLLSCFATPHGAG